MKKRIVSLLLVFCMVITLVPANVLADEVKGLAETTAGQTQTAGTTAAKPENPFADVKSGSWYEAAVLYARANGFFDGTSATTFEPDGPMTRAMFVTVLGRMAGVKAADYAGATDFTDVAEGTWYAPFVKWAARYGITTGTGNGKFSPDGRITREEMAVFFVRYFETFDAMPKADTTVTTKPADLDEVSSWAQDAVGKLWALGLLNGDGKSFDPKAKASRAQTAALCERTDRAVETWYSEPGVKSERVSVEPGSGQETGDKKPEEQKPSGGGSSGGGTSGGNSGGSSGGGGTTTTTYYEVKFAAGEGVDGSVTLPETKTYAQGTLISELPTPTKAGAIFLGWFYNKELTQGVEIGDTVTRNTILYAKMAAGEEVQSIETPNYVTKADVKAGGFTFNVTGVNSITQTGDNRTLSFINVTGGNMDMEYTVSGTTVSATLEAGQTYQVELLDDNARFELTDDGKQPSTVRILNILTKKENATNASLNGGVKQIPVESTADLEDAVFNGLYTIDEMQTLSENTTADDFTYTGNDSQSFSVGDTLAVTRGAVQLNDVTSTEGDVAYIKITGVLGNNRYSYEMADVEDVLFLPDVLPIESGWDKDSSSTTVTISAENLSTALKNVDANSLDAGDYLGFISGAYNSETTDAGSYGKVTGFTQSDGDYIISYVLATEDEIEKALDVYYEQDKDIPVSETEKAQITAAVKQDIENSDYAEQAAAYVMAVMLESDGLDTAPNPVAVAQTMDGITTYVAQDSIVLYAAGKKAEVKVDRGNFKINIDGYAEHLNGSGFDISVSVPITLEMDGVTIQFTAEFEEEVILSQRISTKRHKIGFLRYDYSLNASFDIGNYTGIHFTANIQTDDGEDDNLSDQLEEILNGIKDYTNVGSGMEGTIESLSDIYQNVMDSASDSWVDIIDQKIFETNGSAFLHIFCYQVKGSFVVSVNMAVAMGMDFEYTTRKQYNFSVRVKAKTSTNETIDLITPHYNFDFYVIGTIGVRAGIRLEMYVGLISLKIDKIGIAAEVGAYAQLWGYFFYHLDWTQGQTKNSNSAGAMLIEIGMYLDIKFVASLFNSSKLTWAPTIYANQWPLWSAGERQNVYAFDKAEDMSYTFRTVKTLALPGSAYAMKAMDLKTGEISTINKDDSSESAFIISFSNPKFSYDASTNTVTVTGGDVKGESTDMTITWKKTPLSFTSKPIQKVFHITWSDPEGVRYISFNSMGGSAVAQLSGGEGAAITWPEDPAKTGYVFDGWYKEMSYTNRVEAMSTMPKFVLSKGMILYAKWRPAADTRYTVEHYQEQLNGKYELTYTEQLTGTTDAQTAAEAKTYTGFTAKPITQQTIAPDGSTVVQVYYDRKEYTVTWKPENGTDNVIQTYKHGAELVVPTVSREGYIFGGWGTVPKTVTGDAAYTASWEGRDNAVTFETKGGTAVTAQTVKTGDKVTAPSTPAKTGYLFGGWYTDQGCTKAWDFDADTVKSAMTLYAKWTANTYTATFDPNSGVMPEGEETNRSVTYDQPYGKLPTPTKQGYDFVGWFTEKAGGEQILAESSVSIAANQTLYAHWTAGLVEYTVNHYQQNVENDGYSKADFETLNGTTGTDTKAAAKAYEGFSVKTFEQKTIAAEGSTVIDIYYDRLTYTVQWMNGETPLETDENVKYGTKPAYDGKTPERTGIGYTFTFAGWNTAADGAGAALSDSTTVTDNVVYYAQFNGSVNTYSITYENVDGVENSNPATYTYGTAVALADLIRDGYTFGGWFTDSSYSDGSKVSEITATDIGDKIFYAKWTANTYTVTFDPNGGMMPEGEETNRSVTYDQSYGTLPTPTLTGHTFEGWYTDVDGGEQITESTSVRITANQTLYARWTANVYQITYVCNLSGVSNSNPRSYTYGNAVTLNDLAKTGYTFGGWFTDSSCSEENQVTGITATDIENKTFYAKWTANQYTVTFDANKGMVTPASMTVTYDRPYGELPTPTRANYTFLGWFTTATSSVKVEASTAMTRTEDHTLYAQWAAKDTNLWVGGKKVTVAGSGDVFGNGTVSYNPGTRTLTLHDYTYSGAGYHVGDFGFGCIVYKGDEPLTLNLVGSNTLTYSGNNEHGWVVYSASDLIVEGTGSLTVADESTGHDQHPSFQHTSYGIRVGGDLTVNSGTVSATAHDLSTSQASPYSKGVYCSGVLTVNGGSLTGHGGKVTFTEDLSDNRNAVGYSYGIDADKGIVIDGGTVTASSGGVEGKGPQQFSAQALGAVPVCSDTLTAKASTNTTGESLEDFDSSKLNRYLYFTVS